MQMIWTDPALDRVREIAVHVAQDDPEAAERWVNKLFDVLEQLGGFPESGRVVPEMGRRTIREIIFGAYRVFYRVGVDVEILSVRHGRQLIRAEEVHED